MTLFAVPPEMSHRSRSSTSARSVVSVEDLSNHERAVSLYASDMPTRYSYDPAHHAQLSEWIVQGATRLGLVEVRHWAACAYGYRLMWLADRATPEQAAAHSRRFPSARRYDVAERMASVVSCWAGVDMAPAARPRGADAVVEGGCPCGDTGWIADTSCPVHNRDGLRRFPRAAVAA
jgi:hypothetical protein